MGMDLKSVRELIKLLRGTDIAELNIETEGMKIGIRRGYGGGPQEADEVTPVPEAVRPARPRVHVADRPAPEPERGETYYTISAPMVGTFYRAPSPDVEPYVDVGSIVEPGDPVCIIEAMKLMNEIEAEERGRVIQILSENGQPVEYGQPLFVLERLYS